MDHLDAYVSSYSIFRVFAKFEKLQTRFGGLKPAFFTIFAAANLNFPSFFAGARAWAQGPGPGLGPGPAKKDGKCVFSQWVVEPLPRKATVSTPSNPFLDPAV